ncbi:glycoside hydrolase family 3 N-terminal domain-containing protein [Adhaeribacter radiodurans]|uniref:beta-N-acetylhexosaminidase n=1 Tax=Adhaeribacter radiodurans TaxID=2745197 RepID=A0A7L7L494_9BACT|nr:glycoside hydrolase family 3 N-terminal domain-containing protein [Adhaeribacter radiodurans]QMU27593.1 serine hydrolase [Adhaeribacter radiodurans]
MWKRILLLVSVSVFLGLTLLLSSYSPTDQPVVSKIEQNWVDSVFSSLTFDQRLGQLFMVTALSNRGSQHVQEIEKLVTQYNIGGLMFLYGSPYRQASLTNQYQSKAKVPLLIAMDAEWGLNMRLDSSMHFAKQMTLGAMADEHYVYLMAQEIALNLHRLGVQVSFSPVLDVNSNPKNPVIGNRSFGESKEQVSRRGIAYIKGLQDNGIIAVAKHFPGHGDTDTDSHRALPVINSDLKRLTEVDLYPFVQSFQAGVKGVMVGHLYMPQFDSSEVKATTLSHKLVTGLLKQKMNYQGLVFTDALNMKSVTRAYKPGQLDAMALLAGNDVLLFSENVPTAITEIKNAIGRGEITPEDIDARVRKILHAKYWAGLGQYRPINLSHLKEELNRPHSRAVQHKLYEQSVTVVANHGNLLPFREVDTTRYAHVSIGIRPDNPFTETLQHYAPFATFNVRERYVPDSVFINLRKKLRGFDVVVVSLHSLNSTSVSNYGIGEYSRTFIQKLQKENPRQKVVVCVLGNAYSLKYFEGSKWLVCSYEDNPVSQSVTPQVLFGSLPAQGKLPVTASAAFPAGFGLETASLNRLRYDVPESVGLDSNVLSEIDELAIEAINTKATPGCQVLVARDGAIVFNKSYGKYTYEGNQSVTTNTLYDIASITKAASTLQAIMYLKDQGKLDLNQKLSYYLPEVIGSNKQNLIIKDILLHQAGLQPGIPNWQKTLASMQLSPTYYASAQTTIYPNEVAPGIYSVKTMEDSLWSWTLHSRLLPKKRGVARYEMKYSDLSFYILKRVAERLLQQPLAEFNDKYFYQRLGLHTLTYNPLNKFPKEQIAPTEYDNYFRRSLIWGTVHDQAAAMLGGVAGHAGLFSTATDLAVLMEMNRLNGNYGGIQYFKTPVVTEFAQQQDPTNRRGLGWDKPNPNGFGPTSIKASINSFGHTGFTGTCAWVDPDQKLVYIFLSNRVYPNAANQKLLTENFRTRIHDVIYKAILTKS